MVFIVLFVTCKSEDKSEILTPLNKKIGISTLDLSNVDIPVLNIDNSNCTVINIPENVFKSTIEINELVENINFIPLETNKNCLIGVIDNILSDSGFYFIHDQKNNKLFRFDYQGKFLNNIGNIGHGPRELISIWDISIDIDKKLVSILDTAGGKIVRYKYSGEFFDSKPLYYFFKQLEYEKNNLVFNKGKSISKIEKIGSYSLILSDTNQKPIYKGFKYDFKNNKPANNFTTNRPLRKFTDKVYYHHPHSNGIWQISDNRLIPLVRFNYEERGLPDNTWKKQVNREEIIDLFEKHIYFSGDFVINNQFHFFKICKKNDCSSFFFNTKTKKVKYGNSFEENTGKPFNLVLFGDPISCRDDNLFISIKTSEKLNILKNQIKKYPQMKKKITLEDWEKLKRIDETSNPVIVTYKLKDF